MTDAEYGEMMESPLPEAANIYLYRFYQWASQLPLEDVKQVLPILQTIRSAHTPEKANAAT
jgi:hypothetical protein